jgi:hypothetical protein
LRDDARLLLTSENIKHGIPLKLEFHVLH